MVIVVEGGAEVTEEVTFDQTITEHVDEFVEKGMSKKDAIKEVAKIRKLNKNLVYEEYGKDFTFFCVVFFFLMLNIGKF